MHLKFEAEHFIRSGWGFECFMSHAEINKNGVPVLFNNTFEHKVLKAVRDPSGCFILMDVEIIKKMHSPCKCIWHSTDKPDCFDHLSQEIEYINSSFKTSTPSSAKADLHLFLQHLTLMTFQLSFLITSLKKSAPSETIFLLQTQLLALIPLSLEVPC